MKKGKKLKLLADDLEAIIIERNDKPFVIILKDTIKAVERIKPIILRNNERDLKYLKDYLDKLNNL